MKQEIACAFKGKKQEKLMLEITERQYICIQLEDKNEKTKAALYAKYFLQNSTDIECSSSFTVHIETIKVDRKYRRKKIATLMFQTLINQLLQIEKKMKCAFVYIYGEVGKDGGDNPRLSMPFYRSLHEYSFGEKRKMVLRITEGKSMDGLDSFCYYIVCTGK